MHVTELSDSNFVKSVSPLPVAVVDVYASWCGSCRLFAPTYETIASKNPGVRFFKIDGDTHPNFRAELSIDGLPYFAVYKNGKFDQGITTTNEEALLDFLRKAGAVS
jgi:thioredoxin 1